MSIDRGALEIIIVSETSIIRRRGVENNLHRSVKNIERERAFTLNYLRAALFIEYCLLPTSVRANRRRRLISFVLIQCVLHILQVTD